LFEEVMHDFDVLLCLLPSKEEGDISTNASFSQRMNGNSLCWSYQVVWNTNLFLLIQHWNILGTYATNGLSNPRNSLGIKDSCFLPSPFSFSKPYQLDPTAHECLPELTNPETGDFRYLLSFLGKGPLPVYFS